MFVGLYWIGGQFGMYRVGVLMVSMTGCRLKSSPVSSPSLAQIRYRIESWRAFPFLDCKQTQSHFWSGCLHNTE